MRFINVSTDNYRGRGMRKYPIIPLFFATLVTLALVIGCGDDPVSEPIPTAGTSAQAPEPTAVPVSEWQPGTRQLVDLYREFHAFKHSPKFKLHGFAVCCEYNKWLQKVNWFDRDRSYEAFDDIGVNRAGLYVLALHYVHDDGPQSPYAKKIEAKLEAARKAVEGTSTISEPIPTAGTSAQAPEPTAVPVSEWQPGTRQLVDLYREFHAFKHSPKFKLHGFAVCCEYNKWLQKVLGIDVDSGFEALDDIGVNRAGLYVLALHYVHDDGPQSPYAKKIEAKLEAARKAVEGTSTTTNNPRATTTLPAVAECPTEAEKDYLQVVYAQIGPMAEAMGAIGTLFLQSSENLALLRDDTWITNMATQLYILEYASDALRELEPPTKRLNAVHAYTAGIEVFTTAIIAEVIEGVNNLDVQAITQAGHHMNTVTSAVQAWATAVAALCN